MALNETAMRQAQRDYERALEQREKELVAAVYKRIQDAEASLVATRERCNQLNNEASGIGVEKSVYSDHIIIPLPSAKWLSGQIC